MTQRFLRLPPAALLILACAFWGATTVLNKALLASVPPVTLLVIQLATSVLALWAALALTGIPRPPRAALRSAILLGLLNPGLAYTFGLMGLARVSASVTTLLWSAEPLMILALAALVLREPVTSRLVAIMVLGTAGVALIADPGAPSAGGNDPLGIAFLLLAVLCCAFYTVYSRKISTAADPLATVVVQQTAGLAFAVGLALTGSSHGTLADLAELPAAMLAAAALSGLLYYSASYWLYLTALGAVPAAVAGAYFNAIPVFGVGLAVLVLGENLSPAQWTGAGIVLASVFALIWLTRDAGRAPG